MSDLANNRIWSRFWLFLGLLVLLGSAIASLQFLPFPSIGQAEPPITTTSPGAVVIHDPCIRAALRAREAFDKVIIDAHAPFEIRIPKDMLSSCKRVKPSHVSLFPTTGTSVRRLVVDGNESFLIDAPVPAPYRLIIETGLVGRGVKVPITFEGDLVSSNNVAEDRVADQLDSALSDIGRLLPVGTRAEVGEPLDPKIELHFRKASVKGTPFTYEIEACAEPQGHATGERKCASATSSTERTLDLKLPFVMTPDTAGDSHAVVTVTAKTKLGEQQITRIATADYGPYPATYPPSMWDKVAEGRLQSAVVIFGALSTLYGASSKVRAFVSRGFSAVFRRRKPVNDGRLNASERQADDDLPNNID
ncbi:hypothetical protein ACWEOW_07200 [Monashia sp. NPDC004114]